jgi:hypothetical protein
MTTTTEARERPILFSDAMVRAILDGRKVQTRRLVGPSLGIVDGHTGGERAWRGLDLADAWVDPGPSPAGNPGPYLKVPRDGGDTVHRIYAPWEPGDHLWVREAHAIARLDYWHDYWVDAPEEGDAEQPSCMEAEQVCYRATPRLGWRRWVGPTAPAPDAFQGRPHALTYLAESSPLESGPAARVARWRPSIHMPRWASRLTLRVTDVRVERLQSISEEDARWEGVGLRLADEMTPDGAELFTKVLRKSGRVGGFAMLWNSINGADLAKGWAANPWVWVVGFERVTP